MLILLFTFRLFPVLAVFLFQVGLLATALPARFATKPNQMVGDSAPDFPLTLESGEAAAVSTFRGRWLLLQFGASWRLPSESNSTVFSRIRRTLEGRPFEFVEIYEDPSLTDAEIFSAPGFSGKRALAPDGKAQSLYAVQSFPTWFLIDPQGVIRMAGETLPPWELQKIIEKTLSTDKAFQGLSLDPPTERASLEKNFFLAAVSRGSHEERLALWERVLVDDPDNPHALCQKARCLAWMKGYPEALRFLRETISRQPGIADSVKTFAATYGMTDPDLEPTVEALRDLVEKHPDSVYLKGLELPWTKQARDLTPEEVRAAFWTFRHWGSDAIMQYIAFYATSQGLADKAQNLFDQRKLSVGTERLGEAVFLESQGNTSAALEVTGPARGTFTAETANPAQAWQEMLRFTVARDWAKVMAFASRYETVRPGKIQGILFQMLAALRTGDQPAALALRKKAEDFFSSSPAYKASRPLLSKEPAAEDFLKIKDTHKRFETVLGMILFTEMAGHPETAQRIAEEALRAFSPTEWAYAILFQMTAPRKSAESPSSQR